MEKVAIGSYLPPTVTMTTPNQPQSLSDEESEARVNSLLSYPDELNRDQIDTLGAWSTPALRPALRVAVLEIFQAVDERRAQILRKEQQDQALKDRALAAKKQVLTGDLSGISLDDLPAVLAGLNSDEMQKSLWLILAGVAIAQDRAGKRDLAEMLYFSKHNTFCFGLRKKFSRTAILGIIDAYGEEAEDKIAFLPPEKNSLYWHLISRNSREYIRAQHKRD